MNKMKTLGWLICGMGMIFYSYEFLLRIAPSVMEPQLRDFFDISATGFGSLVGVYYLVYTPMQIVVGPLLDLYGPRIVLTVATGLCALGSFMFALTHSLFIAGVGRFLIGLGSAFAFVGAMKLAAVWLPANRFATFAGLVTALGMVGGMVGDIGLTPIVSAIGWRDTIFFGAIFGVVLMPLMAIIIRNAPPHQQVTHAQVNLSEISKELVKIVRNRQIWLSGVIACLLYLSLSAYAEVWGIPYLRSRGFSADNAAWANSMVFMGWLLGSPLLGLFSDAIKKRRLPLMLSSVIAGISISAVLYLNIHSLLFIAVCLFLFGFFCGAEVICFAIAYDRVSQRIAATTIAFVNMLTMAGGFIFQPLIGKFLDAAWSGVMQGDIRVYPAQDFQHALSILPLAMLLAFLLLFALEDYFKATER